MLSLYTANVVFFQFAQVLPLLHFAQTKTPICAGAAGPRLFTIHQIDASPNNLPKAHTW